VSGLTAPLVAGLLVLPGLAAAQVVGARGLIVGMRTTTATAATDLRLSGSAFGLEGGIGLGPAALTLRYLEGSVRNDTAAVERDFAEGDLTLWARPFRWAALGAGPHVRSFVATGSTERWLFWEVRARASAGLLPRTVDAYLEGWVVVSGDVDVPDPFNAGRGVEGGLEVAVGRLPVSVRLRYRAERIALGDGARRETTEHVMLGVGIGRR
jgi:hypothetical protein